MNDENKNVVTTTETVEDVKDNSNNQEPKVETDWKKEHRDELNRMFAAERENERNKVLNEVQQQKDEAIKQASEKGVPISIINTLNYKNETAESIKEKIEIYAKEIQGIKTNVISEFSKEEAPQTGDNNRKEEKTGYEKFAENYGK